MHIGDASSKHNKRFSLRRFWRRNRGRVMKGAGAALLLGLVAVSLWGEGLGQLVFPSVGQRTRQGPRQSWRGAKVIKSVVCVMFVLIGVFQFGLPKLVSKTLLKI